MSLYIILVTLVGLAGTFLSLLYIWAAPEALLPRWPGFLWLGSSLLNLVPPGWFLLWAMAFS